MTLCSCCCVHVVVVVVVVAMKRHIKRKKVHDTYML
jgi:hypothetical protein